MKVSASPTTRIAVTDGVAPLCKGDSPVKRGKCPQSGQKGAASRRARLSADRLTGGLSFSYSPKIVLGSIGI